MNSEPEEESTTARLMGLVREEWEAPLRARVAVLESALRAAIADLGQPQPARGPDTGRQTAVATLTAALHTPDQVAPVSPQARIDAALAEMDRSSYGDPEVPFRMRAALVEGQS